MNGLLQFLQAMLIGLGIAAPVGPIGLLTIQRTLAHGRNAGLATGLGAAAADACYGALGAFGVSLVVNWLVSARFWLTLAGGAVMLFLAWQTWRAPLAEHAAAVPDARRLINCFTGTFVLTLSNPATILAFLAIFSSLSGGGSQPGNPPLHPGLMVLGVSCGSALWWWLLTAGVGHWRERFDLRWRRHIQRGSAIFLALFALAQWASALR